MKHKGKKGAGKEAEPVRNRFGLPIISREKVLAMIGAVVGTRIIIGLATTFIFHSFIDYYVIGIYAQAALNVLHGMVPWANNVIFYYPPLALVPLVISLMGFPFAGFFGFVVLLWVLMAACDIVTTICVYYIGLKLYSERTAFIAAILNATAISVAYYSITRWEAWVVCLAMLAVMVTVYGRKTLGYVAAIAGAFAKIWPVLLFPFLWIYNAKDSSILEEGKKRALWILGAAGLAFGLMLWAGYDKFLEYANMVYCNTIPYTVFEYVRMAGIPAEFGQVASLFEALLVITILAALYWMYRRPQLSTMLKGIFLALFVVTTFVQYRSPQYIAWLAPFAALLIAGDTPGILAFWGVQVLEYISFPLTFYGVWVNDNYVSWWALPLFTVLFLMYGLLVWRAMKGKGIVEWSPQPAG